MRRWSKKKPTPVLDPLQTVQIFYSVALLSSSIKWKQQHPFQQAYEVTIHPTLLIQQLIFTIGGFLIFKLAYL